MKQACEELRRLHDDDQREVADMRMLHQQVPLGLSIYMHVYADTDENTCTVTNISRWILSAHAVVLARSLPSQTALEIQSFGS